ncbi:MAG: SIR2 family protein [Anaerolineae bacterium]
MANNHIPQELVERIAGGNVVLFLGSETVVRTEAGLARPSWREITALLAQRCGYSEPDMSLAKVAQYFEMTQGPHALITAIADIMADPSYVPAPVHQLIAQLPINFIVTTSIDTLLEQALRAVGRWPQVVVTITDAAGLDVEKTTVVKLFGDIERKEIVITEDDHYGYEQHSPMMAELIRQQLVANTLLFINCDLDDVHLKSMCAQVTQRLGRLKGRSYAVDPSPSDYCRRFWEDKETQIIEADAQTFLEDLLEVLEAYEARAEEKRPEVALRGRPFKRLDYYTEEDADIFYGRKDETDQLISSILAHQLLVLVGASGTGKTSLLLAGAKPALEGGDCRVAYARVMGDPLADLRGSIEGAVGMPLGPGPLRDQLAALEAERDLVVFLDQFEEFFLPKFGQAVQQSFVGELARCLESRSVRTRFVISLRSEALINLLSFKSDIPYIVNNALELQPLAREQAALAITEPLKRFGVTLEEGLLERVVDDLDGEGINPPQLQIVCDRLYDRVLREPRPEITAAIYEELGGADTILGEYLDEELEKLDEAQRRLARVVLQALVTAAGTKEPRSLAQIMERAGLASDELEGILGELDRLRLVRALKSDSEVRYELVHDYLAERISGWLDERARQVEKVRGVLDRGLSDWQHSEELLDLSRVKDVYALRDDLGDLGPEKNALLLRSAARYEYEMDYWLGRVPEVDDQVACLTEVLAPKWTAEERIHAIRCLSRIKTGEVARTLQRVALEDDAAQVRQAAAVGLARTGVGAAVEELAQVAWEARGDQRTRAVEALAWVWDTNAALLPDLSWSLYEKVARRVARIRLGRARGSIRSVTVSGAVGGAIGFALGLVPAFCLNFVEIYGAAMGVAMSLAIIPLAIAVFGILGLIAGALVAAGISTGQALGPGRRVLAPTLGGIVGGAIGLAVGLGPYALAYGQSPLTVVPPAAMAGALLACGIAIVAGVSRAPFAKIVGGALGGTLGFGLLTVLGILPATNRILLLVAGPIIGLAIAYGIARGEAPAARSEATISGGRGL